MHATHTVDDVLSSLGALREGLGDAEISERHAKYGFNELPEKKRSLFLLFLRQFNSILVYILFAALALSILLPVFENDPASLGFAGASGALVFSDFLDAIAIGAILILNACLGFFQERKAENAIASLKALSEPNVRVKRGGKVKIIPSRELVPGDILLLEEGDKISADGRVMFSRGAKVNEASLTGESLPEIKKTDPLEEIQFSRIKTIWFSVERSSPQEGWKYVSPQSDWKQSLEKLRSLFLRSSTRRPHSRNQCPHLGGGLGLSS